MQKSRSLFSQLHKKAIFYGLVDECGWFSQMLASRKTTAEYTKLTKISALSAPSAVIKITVSISVNPCLISLRAFCAFLWLKLRLWRFSALNGKINQNELNYAKRTQFPKKSNGCNASINKELQRKMHNGHLVKTNPNKANFTRPYGG
jgi:hypothetical protein